MSDYWTPSGDSFLTSATAKLVTSVSGQVEGVARIVNVGATTGFILFATASATIGVSGLTPIEILGNATLYIAFSEQAEYIFATGAEEIYAQPGYALK